MNKTRNMLIIEISRRYAKACFIGSEYRKSIMAYSTGFFIVFSFATVINGESMAEAYAIKSFTLWIILIVFTSNLFQR